jgi:cell division septum initiation protein DivIVA
VLDRQDNDKQNALQVTEAADRAGAIVTDHIRSIIDQAEANATEIRRAAEAEADALRQRAAQSASRILERIDALDGPLSELVAGLRREADALTSDSDGRSR